ncbi:protein FAR1-RELATED SEQUENCE 5-like [Silene latifolia]|uniref:protein FAR1-RELATED SEQUENCE 5-like n=1 Tax=Silene latifolia TaxID=37657 RepID=UPI003D78ABAB
MIEFRYNGDGYVVFRFREWHNHRLCSLRNQQFQKKHRHLHLYHKKTIIDHSRVNQGPTRAFRNVKEYVDGYENVGAQLVDFKNFGRDIKCFIGDRDAQLFVNYFEDKRDTSEGFYFAYEVDSGKCLVRAFWCDAESRRNYALFGDYITYDPTYKFNKYCWAAISRETDFVGRLNAIVWDAELEPLEFEEKWCQLVNEHNLDGNSWLSTMFRKRRKWIPAYFRDVPMGCLLRTTQRSESQNNFFKRFENAHGTLVEFLMRFQSAIDVQRHTQKQLDRDDDCTLPQLATSLKLEAHASKVYTNAAFSDFQVEASASICSLSVGGFTPPANGVELIGIADARSQKTYQVVYNSLTNDAECSCKLFNRKGIICRHIIWVYSENKFTLCPINTFLCGGPRMHIRSLFMVHLGETQSAIRVNDQRAGVGDASWVRFLNEVRILPPRQAKNKGSGKRMISKKQQCIAKAEKPKRLCRNCKQMAHHDKRIVLMLLYLMPTISTQDPLLRVTDRDIGSSDEDDDADDG